MSLCLQLPLPSNFVVLLVVLTPVYPAITQLLNIHLPALLLAAYFQITAKERKVQTSWFTDFTSCLDTHLGTHTPELPVVFLRFSFPATLSWLRFLSLIKSHVLVKMFAYWVCFWVHPSYWPLGLLTWSSINLRWRRDTGFFSLSSAR